MIFTEEIYNDEFSGFIIKDCIIAKRNRQVYLLVEDNDEKSYDGFLPEYRFVYTFNERPDPIERYFSASRTHLNRPKLSYNGDSEEVLALDLTG